MQNFQKSVCDWQKMFEKNVNELLFAQLFYKQTVFVNVFTYILTIILGSFLGKDV
jgi:hypothetical protein